MHFSCGGSGRDDELKERVEWLTMVDECVIFLEDGEVGDHIKAIKQGKQVLVRGAVTSLGICMCPTVTLGNQSL